MKAELKLCGHQEAWTKSLSKTKAQISVLVEWEEITLGKTRRAG